MSGKTRNRILDVALRLFNEQGETNISTNHIADELEISPGNLYYHYRNKDDIIEQLFLRFEERMDQALVAPEGRDVTLEDVWLQLHLVFECIWNYRFIYRDIINILSRNRNLRLRFARILKRGSANAQGIMRGLNETGAMRASAAEIEGLATNILVLATFWLNYANVRGEKDEQRAIQQGIVQVMMLVSPFLRDRERLHLHTLSKAYTD
ncbi:MAG: TetR/AcrR family transcriptional regulator [Arenimonas sp.]|uniref:TetR/AcrR family transcriptional regulator n=1 Tax=Arenimonas sp. TaxID=1872635 RepID=UPI003C0C2D13